MKLQCTLCCHGDDNIRHNTFKNRTWSHYQTFYDLNNIYIIYTYNDSVNDFKHTDTSSNMLNDKS